MSLPFKLAVGLTSSSSAIGLGTWKFINLGEGSERPRIIKTSESKELELDESPLEEGVSLVEDKVLDPVTIPPAVVEPKPVCSIVQITWPSRVGQKVEVVKEIDSKDLDKESGKKTDRFNEDIKKACDPLGNGKKVYVTYSNGVWNYSGNYQTNWSPIDGIRRK